MNRPDLDRSAAPDALALVKALRRRWPLALGLGLVLGGGLACAAWFLLVAKATAFAQVRVAATPPWMVARNVDTPEGRSEFLTYQRTQAMQIKSRYVLSAALKRDEVRSLPIVVKQADPVAWLEEELRVEYQEGSEFLTISFTGPEPAEAQALVSAIVRAYEKEVIQVEAARRRARVDELEKIYIDASARLGKRKDSLRQMAEDLGTSESAALTQKQVAMQAYLGEIKRQHGQAKAELMKARMKLEAHKNQAKKEPELPEALLLEAVAADPEVLKLQARMTPLREIVADYERRATRKDEGTMIRSQRELDGLDRLVAARREEVKAALTQRVLAKVRGDNEANLMGLTQEESLWAQQEKTLRDEADALGREADKVGRSSTAVELLRAEIAREEKLADRIGGDVEVLKVELKSPPRATVFQDAVLARQDPKKQYLATSVAALAGLAAAGFGVGWWESRARRIHTAEEVSTGLGLRVVGSMPPMPAASFKADAETGQPELVESIDGIRTMLLRDNALRLLMVTSAVAGEGKTTLASQLAGSLARAGRRTLLVDGDFRRPSVHQLFEVPALPGLSEVLVGEVMLGEATRATAVPGLSVLPAGEWDRALGRALAGEPIKQVLASLRETYDFIVLDSHPVLLANDALLVGLHVDAVILSIMSDLSRMPQVSAARQKLTDLGIPVLGAVVNGLPDAETPAGRYQPVATQA